MFLAPLISKSLHFSYCNHLFRQVTNSCNEYKWFQMKPLEFMGKWFCFSHLNRNYLDIWNVLLLFYAPSSRCWGQAEEIFLFGLWVWDSHWGSKDKRHLKCIPLSAGVRLWQLKYRPQSQAELCLDPIPASWVILDKFLNLSVCQFVSCELGIWLVVRMNGVELCEALRGVPGTAHCT